MKHASFVCLFLFLVSTLFAQNPVPFINQPLVPDAVAPGGPQFTLTVNGTGFVSNSVVSWNGSPLASQFVSGSQLTAIVPAADITTAGTASVTVVSPAPGGGTSNVVFFAVTGNEGNAVGFGLSSSPAVGAEPISVVVGDFNGDGKPDLAVANYGGYGFASTVSILLGNGNGNFTLASSPAAGVSAVSLAVGDFNGDGKLDLAVANEVGGVSILLGDGTGNFTLASSQDAGDEPVAVAVGDFNGDGNLDLAVVDWGPPSTVSVLLGDGTGNFTLASSSATGTTAYAVAVGDFNGDGKLDLAVLDRDNSGLFILLGDGTGNFTLASTPAVGGWSVAAGDFNGDGKLDLAVANDLGGVSILLGDGTGNFTVSSSSAAGGEAIAVGDFNGDGKLDLAVAGGSTVSILLGDGTGNFTLSSSPSVGNQPQSVAVADFNGDGKLDLATANYGSNTVSVLLQLLQVAALVPSSLGFGNQPIGTTSAPQIVQLSTNSPLSITSIATSAQFAQTNNCGSSLPADGSCQISVTFTPSASGNQTGTLTVYDSGTGSPQTVQLSGTGTQPGVNSPLYTVGAELFDFAYAYGIAVDSAGNAYVTGSTFAGYPGEIGVTELNPSGSVVYFTSLISGYGIGVDGAGDAYVTSGSSVTELNSSGSAIVYSTSLGSSSSGNDIAVDSAGNVYVAGSGGVTKLNPSGSVAYSTSLVGGSSIAVDSAGNAYVTGTGGVTKLNASGSAIVYSTSLVNGGSIAVDSAGNAYVITSGNSIAKLNPSGSAIVYSTSLGNAATVCCIAVDSAGDAYVTGSTGPGLITVNAFQPMPPEPAPYTTVPSTAFVAELNPSGSLVYSTYYSIGNVYTTGSGIAVDNAGNAYVIGTAGVIEGGSAGGEAPPVAFLAFVAKIGSLGSPSTTTTLSSPNPSSNGQPVTFTATVTSQGSGTPIGTVTFTYGSTILCNAVPLSGGTAACTYSALPIGSDVITASYSGDPSVAPSNGTATQTVIALPTVTTLTSSLNPSLSNQQVTFTATVTGQSGGTPTGTITFSDGATTLGTVVLSGGTATLSTTTLAVGLNSITAVYSGDANFAGSTSAVLGEIVGAVAPASLQANIAGSTAFWLEAGEAAYTLGGTTTTCAWTTSLAVDGSSFVIDQRVPALPQYFPFSVDYGALWVTWTPGTAGGTCAAPDNTSQVWAYISLDSVLGDRCFFAQPQCTLNVGSFNQSTGVVTPLSPGTAGANALPGITDTPIPASVLAAFNGQTISMAATDILPVDAKFSSYSVLSQCGSLGSGTQFIGLGYGPGPFAPQPIYSYFSEYYMNVNDFNVYGTDPADGNPIPAYSITPVGAIPVIVAVNTSNANGFGSPQVANLRRAEVGLLFTDLFLRTADAIPQPFAGTGATYYGVSALIPSPLSGSYNIFEHSITNSKELYRSLDINNCDPYGAPAANPLIGSRNIGSNTAYRYRVIGTNQMLSELQLTQDSIGFELWSAENFAGTSNLKYLSVDGVDPLFNTYSDGTIPQSGNGLLPSVTLSHVADGSYPIWNEERLISSPANAGLAATFAAYTQAQLSFGADATRPDFIPDSQLNVFHMHFAPAGVTFNATNTASDGPKVCGAGSNPEDGGDVGGLVVGLQAGADFCVLKGNYGAPGGVGPTNTAEFGVRQ